MLSVCHLHVPITPAPTFHILSSVDLLQSAFCCLLRYIVVGNIIVFCCQTSMTKHGVRLECTGCPTHRLTFTTLDFFYLFFIPTVSEVLEEK